MFKRFKNPLFKFTPANGSVSLIIDFNNNILNISVKDSGIGISDEFKERIFKPFEQSDSSTTKDFGGTGLGLAICQSIAQMMNGTIQIESKIGEGSTFTFTIPINKVNKPKNTILEESENDITISAHILIAEDNKTNQLLLGMLLDDIGITYDIANDGQEAVQMYEDGKYDLVLMDENMPNMNGVDAMFKIRQNHTNIVPIIAVTANVMKGDESRLLEIGMDGFIPKPIDSDELISTISSYLKKKY